MSCSCGAATGFRHEALFYNDGLDGFVREIAPMVSATLAGGGTAAVAAPTDRVERLRPLFDDHARLELIDMTELGVNPGRIIPAWRELADGALATGRPFLGVGEPIWVGRSDEELDECHRHEALINVAFAEDPAWRLVCPYDVDGLDPAVIADARLTHPTVLGLETGCSHAPVDGLAALEGLERPLPVVPERATTIRFGRDDLTAVRDVVLRRARAGGLSRQRAADLVLAGTEMATNSIRHGGGGGTLRTWHHAGSVVCQTDDSGQITDPMLGRRRPNAEQTSGRGMWILHQLCDLVQVRSSERGTVVRVTVG